MSDSRLVVYAQGMRRSGTTILFDLMLEEGSFECFYEPLAQAKEAFGGGSGAHLEKDLFVTLRRAREDFLKAYPHWLERCPNFRELNYLNYGAPRLAQLEFEPDLPGYCKEYISFLSNTSNRTFLKFTRMHSKVDCLKAIEPKSKFIHIVRDPRHVTCSYLFGKNAKNKARFPDADIFFSRVSDSSSWSSKAFSDFILALKDYTHVGLIEDFKRILLIWRYKFEMTHSAALRCYGDNYLLFRHEDLLERPQQTLDRLEAFLGIQLNKKITSWVTANLRPPSKPVYADDRRWQSAFENLNMVKALQQAGYNF
jgi:hypothetical protein